MPADLDYPQVREMRRVPRGDETMVLIFLRGLFILLMGAVGFFVAFQAPTGVIDAQLDVWFLPVIAMLFGIAVMFADILSPRKKLAILSGTFLGLIVGLLIAYVLSFI